MRSFSGTSASTGLSDCFGTSPNRVAARHNAVSIAASLLLEFVDREGYFTLRLAAPVEVPVLEPANRSRKMSAPLTPPENLRGGPPRFLFVSQESKDRTAH